MTTRVFSLQNIVLNLVVNGLIGIRTFFIGCQACPLIFGETDTVWVWDHVLEAGEHHIIQRFIQVNRTLHLSLRLRLKRLLLFWLCRLDQAAILVLLLLKLLVEVTDIFFLNFFYLRSFNLIDVSNKSILSCSFFALEGFRILEDVVQVAVEEVKLWEFIPRLKNISREDHDMMLV